ncbi:hypothetical protein J1783_08955 [Rahnella sp. L151-1A]|nr:hypothetical protein [Rahnella perminowiae]MBU9825107.1 hypothetical protein [Rahnella perminowiae]
MTENLCGAVLIPLMGSMEQQAIVAIADIGATSVEMLKGRYSSFQQPG